MILPRHKSHRTAGSCAVANKDLLQRVASWITLFGSLKRWPRPIPASVERGHDQGSTHGEHDDRTDRNSTRLNSSHEWISYAVFCLKKKKTNRYGCDDIDETE